MTIRVDGRPARIQPPEGLTQAERVAFAELVGDCPPEHFQRSDRPLLEQYARDIVGERAAFRRMQDLDPATAEGAAWQTRWEKLAKATFNLSLRLRLSPQGRKQHPPKASNHPLSAYERMALEEADDDFDEGRPVS
jgi:hypothetical protein